MNAQMHLCTHKDTSTGAHTKYIKTLRERQTGRRRVDKRQKDRHPYLFVHFNVETVRHLVVLRRTESD